ncbi:MAG: hypothetical protein JW902_04285, partial [Syntrophaceae bacterium]|nr:hypothetical protein [Syntrophaceae bacterium]
KVKKLTLLREMITNLMMKQALKTYIPMSKRESLIMPWVLRMGNPYLVFIIAAWKAKKIYG